MQYFKFDGENYKVDFFSSIEDGHITFSIESPYYEIQTRKVYYRPERTWDDHMGNTPCGYYVNAKLRNKTEGEENEKGDCEHEI